LCFLWFFVVFCGFLPTEESQKSENQKSETKK
jgi:hypothetical protein